MADLERRIADLTARVKSSQSIPPVSPGDEGVSVEQEPGPPSKRADTGRPSSPEAQQQLPSNDFLTMWRASSNLNFPYVGERASEQPIATPAQSQGPERSRPSSPSAQAPSSQSRQRAVNSTRVPSPPSDQDPWYYPTPLESESLLDDFRCQMAPLFPFIVYPLNIGSAQLREQRPLLWKATMTASLQMDAVRQLFLGHELLNDIVKAAFLQPKKSFDILQALQILISWWVPSKD